MNYFMSDVFGASEAYFTMKNRVGFKNNDELYILGNIFDGNDQCPEECLFILEDIMNRGNIHLLLGNHEYAHVMYHMSKDSPEVAEEWEKYLHAPLFNGIPLLKHMCNLSEKERNRYISFLISCEMTDLLKIGKNYFYMVHGSPAVCRQKDVVSWQREVSIEGLSLTRNYSMAIASDPCIVIPDDLSKENTVIVAGHTPTRQAFEDYDGLESKYYKENPKIKSQRVVCENKKMLINCGCTAGSIGQIEGGWVPNLACVAIDAAGFFVEYYITEEDIENVFQRRR